MRRAALLFAASVALLGCPSTPFMRLGVFGAGPTPLRVLEVDAQGVPRARDRRPLLDVRVVCEGCAVPVFRMSDGRFFLDLTPTSPDVRPRIVVTAPGHEPAVISIDAPPEMTEGGFPALVVVLQPEQAGIRDSARR